MSDLQIGAKNKRGFLANPGSWCPDVAKALARAEGIDLSDAHRSVVQAIRDLYQADAVPACYHIPCPLVGDALQPFRGNCVPRMKQLFPDGGIRQASRTAGLPDYFYFG